MERRTTWMTPILKYLQEGKTLEESREAQNVVKEAAKYTLIGQYLYRRGFSFPLLICLEKEESAYVIREVHEGVCGTHIGGRALASKIVRADYFTKWIEAEPVASITFGIPAEIVLDNGTQFASKGTIEFCKDLKIRQSFTSVEHPQSNGQAEVANKVILRGLWRRLEEAKDQWVEELSQVLWSYHTTPHSTTNETPFRLTFGIEAMIPVEIGETSPRTALFEPGENEEELRTNLDLL
ncbi:Tf2-8, partial [Mucuna pruriens]